MRLRIILIMLVITLVLAFLTNFKLISIRDEPSVYSASEVSCTVIGVETDTVKTYGWPFKSREIRENVCFGIDTKNYIAGMIFNSSLGLIVSFGLVFGGKKLLKLKN
jgi:hypothetical protein